MSRAERARCRVQSAGTAVLLAVCVLGLALQSAAQDAARERHVIYLKNAEAAELAEVLNGLIAGTETGDSPPLRIVADVQSNSLVVEATAEELVALEDVIRQLDEPRPQVLLEFALVELRSDADRALESEPLVEAMRKTPPRTGAMLGSSVEVLDGGLGRPTQLQPGEAVLQLGETGQGLETLNTPSVLTADGEAASICVATPRGVPCGYGARSAPRLMLSITPEILDESAGELRIVVETDEAAEPFRGGPWVLRGGQALLLGGPIRTLGPKRPVRVPLLGALPVVGRFLRLPRRGVEESQLLLVMTPRIVRPIEDGPRPSFDLEKALEQIRLRLLSDSWRDLAVR